MKMHQKRRTLPRSPTRQWKKAGSVKEKNLAKQLSELRRLRERVWRAEAARAFR
jgi:hypothetical protein